MSLSAYLHITRSQSALTAISAGLSVPGLACGRGGAGNEFSGWRIHVRHYGAFINSIQMEIADTIRDDDQKRLFLFEDLAFAIINFVRRHAPF